MQHLKPSDAALEARDKLNQTTNRTLNTHSFDRAWQRVYGAKEYRPSWVGGLSQPRPRPAPSYRQKPILTVNDEPIVENLDEITANLPREEKKKVKEFYDLQVQGIPTEHRCKRAHEPLLISGKVVPREHELGRWREMITTDEVDEVTGQPVYNKVVKETNVPNWMKSNSYWKASSKGVIIPSERIDLLSSTPSPRPRENQVIHTARYDLVGKYENKIEPESLKLQGDRELPSKRELKTWGDQLEIPQRLEVDECITEMECSDISDRGRVSEKRRKFDSVLKEADVPRFFSHNNYWK